MMKDQDQGVSNLIPGESTFPGFVEGHLLAVSVYGTERALVLFLSYKGTNPFIRVPPT